MVDIDDFKKINDRWGHQAGDEVLRRIGRQLACSIRGTDLPARYGGEEIAIILPETPFKKALYLADKLRQEVWRGFNEEGPSVTLSIGVSCLQLPGIATATELVRMADKALYEAKRTGKNKVGRCD